MKGGAPVLSGLSERSGEAIWRLVLMEVGQ